METLHHMELTNAAIYRILHEIEKLWSVLNLLRGAGDWSIQLFVHDSLYPEDLSPHYYMHSDVLDLQSHISVLPAAKWTWVV